MVRYRVKCWYRKRDIAEGRCLNNIVLVRPSSFGNDGGEEANKAERRRRAVMSTHRQGTIRLETVSKQVKASTRSSTWEVRCDSSGGSNFTSTPDNSQYT